MADIKTHLRELSVATTIGLINQGIAFELNELYDSKRFLEYAKSVIAGDISSASNIAETPVFTGELKQIVDNGYRLGKAICENKHFTIEKDAPITWQGNDTQKDDPIDITVGNYGFSLKEESFILENMGLYKLLNCYTGSIYKKRHIFKDYANKEYEQWFSVTWSELLAYLYSNGGTWSYNNTAKHKKSTITLFANVVKLEYYQNDQLIESSSLNKKCSLSDFEEATTSKTREQVFSKFINEKLENNSNYNAAKRSCAKAATVALAHELKSNLKYSAGLPRFLRIHKNEYYYAKTTSAGVEIFKVPSIESFGNDIIIESIESSVPDKQANILTTIKNKKTGKTLVLRNECRFSHGQFNGTPEAKLYYEHGGSLEVIYEKI